MKGGANFIENDIGGVILRHLVILSSVRCRRCALPRRSRQVSFHTPSDVQLHELGREIGI